MASRLGQLKHPISFKSWSLFFPLGRRLFNGASVFEYSDVLNFTICPIRVFSSHHRGVGMDLLILPSAFATKVTLRFSIGSRHIPLFLSLAYFHICTGRSMRTLLEFDGVRSAKKSGTIVRQVLRRLREVPRTTGVGTSPLSYLRLKTCKFSHKASANVFGRLCYIYCCGFRSRWTLCSEYGTRLGRW